MGARPGARPGVGGGRAPGGLAGSLGFPWVSALLLLVSALAARGDHYSPVGCQEIDNTNLTEMQAALCQVCKCSTRSVRGSFAF